MKDKKLSQLRKSELIEIIYQLKLNEEKLMEENEHLKKMANERYERLSKAGSIAEAALQINDIFINAQKAADDYLQAVKDLYPDVEELKDRSHKMGKKKRSKR